ncbi:hypothetical protein BRE01_56110 [Brevibacillus reuszeri]|uniref:DUF1453 domain-containing protein n=1 Tax=Brevibacillus reuszeri TaxID=54915 RepID=A0A0K9Z1K2_9BACL|nr:DUF1453 family protein [Brevibacillus reuszeri]KNB74767.1 hypothetical protein ADS79_00105 [Brevibacillus reuszeri]MED1859591.1 DUF1453 family protein [Brevibacillus reuszeri]GED71909.1 hypothetical protein BRE01_56110 [Brevibacillus reuszeri]
MTSYLIIVVIVVLLSLREKEIRPSRLWITPLLFIYLAFSSMKQMDLSVGSLLLYLICLAVGLGVGAWRGKLEKVRLNSATGKVTSQGSVAGVVLFLAVMLLRLLVGNWGAHHALVFLSTSLLFIPLGSVISRRYIIYLKYRQLVEGRAVK